MDAPSAFTDRVVNYLLKRESKEPEIRYRDEYKQARILVALAYKGNPDPFTTASYQIYGVHPSTIWQRTLAARKAKLGYEWDLWYFEDGTIKPDVIIPDYDPFLSRKPPRHEEEFCNQRLPLRILPEEKHHLTSKAIKCGSGW